MNTKKLSIIGTLFAVIAVGIVGLSQIEDQTISNNETLAIAVISPEINNLRPGPMPITLGSHGDSMTQNTIKDVSDLEFATLDKVSEIIMGEKSVSLVDTKLRSNGAVYNYYAPSSVTDSTTLPELMESGAIVVKTRELRNPTVTYTTLANHEDTRNSSIIVNGILAFISEAHDNVPTTLDLYLNDGRVVSVWANASVEDTIKIAEKLELRSGLINLNDYVDPKWIDGEEIDTRKAVPTPEPES